MVRKELETGNSEDGDKTCAVNAHSLPLGNVLEHTTGVENDGDVALIARVPARRDLGPRIPRRED